MATLTKVDSFAKALAEKVHNLGSDSLKIALCATGHAPVVTNTKLTDLTEISYTNLSARGITTTSSAQASGVYKLTLTDLVLTASGTVAAFRYVVLYNDTATNKELIGWYDYGTDINLNTADTLTIDFDATNGVLQLS